MTLQEYAEQMTELGYRVHKHGGVWWQRHVWGFAKPVYELQAFARGSARPALARGCIAFSHRVEKPEEANRLLDYMLLQGDDLARFDLMRLDGKRRNQIRKGLKHCEVRRITDLEACLEGIRQINISHAERHMRRGRFLSPPQYFIRQQEQWQAQVRRQFAAKDVQWWGAYRQGRVTAYIIAYDVTAHLLILVVKTHEDFLSLCVTDALYYTFLLDAARSGKYECIVNSQPATDSLTRYKESFLFKRVPLPFYTSHLRWLSWGRRVLGLKERLRMTLQTHAHKPQA